MTNFVTGIEGTVTGMVTGITDAAIAGLGILAIVYGVRLAIRGFKSVK